MQPIPTVALPLDSIGRLSSGVGPPPYPNILSPGPVSRPRLTCRIRVAGPAELTQSSLVFRSDAHVAPSVLARTGRNWKTSVLALAIAVRVCYRQGRQAYVPRYPDNVPDPESVAAADNCARAAPRIAPRARLRRKRVGPWRERPCVLSPVPNRSWSAPARILCCPRWGNSLRPKKILRRLTTEDDRARFSFLDPRSAAGHRFFALHRLCSPGAAERSDGPRS